VIVMAGLQQGRLAAAAAVVQRASELDGSGERSGVHRVLPVLDALRPLLPGQGLRRGGVIAIRKARAPGQQQPEEPVAGTSLMLALIAEASRTGSWCAVVGVPTLGAAAAAELGIALERLALVPYPGSEWVTVVAMLVDGVDVVVAAPPGPVAAHVASRLAARVRQRGCVLVPLVSWSGRYPGADITLEAVHAVWDGLGQGHGRLRCRRVTISARGRGAATRRRQVQVWLPATPDGWIGTEPARRPAAANDTADVEVDYERAV
jgi:hypothetical protein